MLGTPLEASGATQEELYAHVYMKKHLTWGGLEDLQKRKALIEKSIARLRRPIFTKIKNLAKDLKIIDLEIKSRKRSTNNDIRYLLRHGWVRQKGGDTYNENFIHPILGKSKYSLSGLRSETENFERFKKTGILKYATLNPQWGEDKKTEFKKLLERNQLKQESPTSCEA